MEIRSKKDFKEFKQSIKNGTFTGLVKFYIDIPEDISDIFIDGSVEICIANVNVNFIPKRIDLSLEFSYGNTSLKDLEHDIYCHSFYVRGNGLVSTKGLQHIHTYRYDDFNRLTSSQTICIFISENFQDESVEFLPYEDLEMMKSFEGTLNPSTIFYGNEKSLKAFGKNLSQRVIEESLETDDLKTAVNKAYMFAYDHIGENVLDTI